MQSDTRLNLIAEAETIVRRVGYAAFSYADLAQRVGIRKPSIHHHFPTKEDLGVAMTAAYTDRFAESLADIAEATSVAAERLKRYAGLYRAGLLDDQGCLCGVLASELNGLPESVRSEVRRFFNINLEWLERIISDAQSAGILRSDLNAAAQAAAILSGLEGAMLVARTIGTIETFDTAAIAIVEGTLMPPR